MNERKFGLYVFISLAIGAGLGLVHGNVFNRLWIGVLVGVFIGWFTAAAPLKKQK